MRASVTGNRGKNQRAMDISGKQMRCLPLEASYKTSGAVRSGKVGWLRPAQGLAMPQKCLLALFGVSDLYARCPAWVRGTCWLCP